MESYLPKQVWILITIPLRKDGGTLMGQERAKNKKSHGKIRLSRLFISPIVSKNFLKNSI